MPLIAGHDVVCVTGDRSFQNPVVVRVCTVDYGQMRFHQLRSTADVSYRQRYEIALPSELIGKNPLYLSLSELPR